MSGFNLDFSGMFNSGAFALDPSKFDFSAYSPKKETVTDPIDVVSNKTPDAQVEILEGAGTVAITKADPIEQAIQSVQPKPIDLGMDFSVTPETAVVSPLTSNIPVSSGSTTNGSFMDVGAGQTGLSSNVNTDVGAEKAYDLLDGSLESNNDIEDINNYLKGGQFSDYMSEYDGRLSILGDYKRAPGATTNLLNQVGLPKALGVQGKYGGYKNYTYNGETNQYELTADTERSALDVAAPEVLKAAAIATFTAGFGSALGGYMGSSIAGKATAAGISSLAQGGSPKDALLSAATAGFGEYAKGVQAAATAADATDAIKNTAETLDTIRKTVNVAQAVSSGNTVGAILGGMDLMGLPSVTSMVSDKLTETFPDSDFLTNPDNLEAVSNSLTKFGTKLASGADPQKALASAMWDYVQSDGALPSLDIDIDLGEGWDTPEWMRQIDSEALRPIKEAIVAGYQEVNDKVLNPIQEIGSAAAGVVREAGRDVREAVDPYSDVVREAGRDVREAVDPLANEVREVGRDVREFASENSDIIQQGLDALGGVLGGPGQQGGQRMAAMPTLNNSLMSIEGPELTQYESLNNNLLQQLRI